MGQNNYDAPVSFGIGTSHNFCTQRTKSILCSPYLLRKSNPTSLQAGVLKVGRIYPYIFYVKYH